MSLTDKLVGVDAEIVNDPRVQELVNKIESKEVGDVASIVASTPPDLSKYGIKLRPASLMQQTMLVRVIGALKKWNAVSVVDDESVRFDVPAEYQPFMWTFLLGAPKIQVFKALDELDAKGLPAMMEIVSDWFDSLNLPSDASVDILQAMTTSFERAMRAMKFMPSGGDDEKKVIPPSPVGSSTYSTSSLPSTVGTMP